MRCNLKDGIDPFIHLVLGLLRGEYEGSHFAAIFQAFVTKEDKKRRGVGMQNFSYLPALRNLVHTIHMQSPAAYKIPRTTIPMEVPWTIR